MPVVRELSPPPDREAALAAVADWPTPLLLDSARPDAKLGRYSFLTADPVHVRQLETAEFGVDPFASIRREMARIRVQHVDGLPPFQGGAAGLLCYELGGCWERLPVPPVDEFTLPAMTVGLYDWVLAWDHQTDRAWLIVHDIAQPAARRAAEVAAALESTGPEWHDTPCREHTARRAVPQCSATQPAGPVGGRAGQVRRLNGPTHHSVPECAGVGSNFSQESYVDAVGRVIDYIRAGDVFQVNISQRLTCRTELPPRRLYQRLRRCNPAPFGGFFAHDDWAVLSASPERFLNVEDGLVETRPIKGTRRRRSVPEADLFTRDELRESEKDQAENVMIVDLLRNDLSRVCRPGTIRVPKLCAVETYQTVQHLVSEVHGRLEPDRDFWDLLAAAFPGGSITGAPKVRAMQIIQELERLARGPYCGSLFYLGFDGGGDSNILIRTFVQRGGRLACGVGGGITAQSDPQAEYNETLDKAAGMLAALPP